MKTLRKLKRQLHKMWLSLYIFLQRLPNKYAIGTTIIGLAALIFCSVIAFTPEKIVVVEATNTVETSQTTRSMSRAEPTRLRIEVLGIDAPFISLGLKPDGSMETPSKGTTVGWYTYAPTPGEIGPAIVAGHVDTKAGPAIFARLNKLKPGEKFEVYRADGSIAVFQVNEVKQYAQQNFPTEEVYGNIDYAGIRLITCGGTFSQTTKRYSHNTVVFGSLIIE